MPDHSLQGRVSRDTYAREVFALRLAVAVIGAVLLTGGVYTLGHFGSSPTVIVALAVVYLILLALVIRASVSLAVRRMHDLGASGWWVALDYAAVSVAAPLMLSGVATGVLVCIPIGLALLLCGGAISLVRLSVPGQPTANRYGDPPMAIVEATPGKLRHRAISTRNSAPRVRNSIAQRGRLRMAIRPEGSEAAIAPPPNFALRGAARPPLSLRTPDGRGSNADT
jgi:uncharacterized membrane protein YhaH (DUF805 family)